VSLAYPAWWRGGRWDVERLLKDLYTYPPNLAAADLHGVTVEPFNTWMHIPAEVRDAHLDSGNAYLLVHRNGGHVERVRQQWCDVSMATLGVMTQSRDESNELMAYVTDVLVEFDEGGIVARSTPHRSGASTTYMTVSGEVTGPQLQQELVGDDRLVLSVWQLNVDRPRGLPNYRALLGLD
jgi:hypothetical protein